MKLFRNLLVCLFLVVATFLMVRLVTLVDAVTAAVNEFPGELRAARIGLLGEVGSTSTELVNRADRQATALRGDLNRQLTAALGTADSRVRESLGLLDLRSAAALSEVSGFRQDLRPVLAGATSLTATYAAIPDRLADELRPSWNAIEPEFTCKKDGSGYGGCWHSRVTALMGEAANVGGVFTQQFPQFARSLNGMAADGHAWTDKYVMPHPLTFGGKLKAAGKVTLGLGTAALRGGIF